MKSNLCPERIIIIDHGASSIRIGFATNDFPQITMSSIVGTKRNTIENVPGMSFISPNEVFFGEQAIKISHLLRMETTIDDRRTIKKSAKKLYTKLFTEMGIAENLSEYSLLFIVSSFADKNFIESLSELFLTSFKFARLALISQAGLYFNSDENGILVDIGETMTDVVYVKANNLVSEKSTQLELGTMDLVNYIKSFYDDNRYFKFNSTLLIKKFTEENVSVSLDGKLPQNTTTAIPFTVEDDSTYNFGVELLTAGEILFKPDIVEKNCQGLSSIVSGLLSSEDEKIIIVGGGSKIPGLKARIAQDISKFNPSLTSPTIADVQYDTTLSNWILAHEYIMKQPNVLNSFVNINYSKFRPMFYD